jgi:hypothetical protein
MITPDDIIITDVSWHTHNTLRITGKIFIKFGTDVNATGA